MDVPSVAVDLVRRNSVAVTRRAA